jgi:hypothetical protein
VTFPDVAVTKDLRRCFLKVIVILIFQKNTDRYPAKMSTNVRSQSHATRNMEYAPTSREVTVAPVRKDGKEMDLIAHTSQ